jgi:hypothetical protein
MAVFATAAEMPGLVAKMSAIWAVGLTVGGPIGSAMAERHTVTWRWAFYLNLPLVGLAVIVAVLCLPPHSFAAQSSLWKRLSKMDPVGILLNMTSPALLALALTFSGPVWAWYSAEGIALWSLAGLSFVAWAVQQSLCILTTREERAFPVHILRRLDLIPIWIASGCAGTSYGITMYYTPLFFAFAKGHDPLEQTVRTLPFICTFIFTLLFTGYVLPMLGRYKIIYLLAGIVTLSAGVAMASLLDKDTPESPVMGLEALLGFGLGLHFQHGVGVSNVINRNPVDRVDSTIVTGMCQMGFISVSLAVAGCIFQNVGYSQLAKALSSENYSEDTLREALAGFSSVNWHSGNMDLVEKGAQAVIHVISIEFYIVMAAGALCLACALEMSWAKLDYGQ